MMLGGARTLRNVALAARQLSKRYGAVQALRDVSLTVGEGEVVGLVGENGAGKSTLLSIMNGRVRPDSGALKIRDQDLRLGNPAESAALGIATVYQEQGLVPTISVYENMFLGREARFTTLGFMRRRALISSARDTLETLGIGVSPTAYTGSLSFSDRQMVEIAKAFAVGSAFDVEPIILLDEPTSALSERETEQLLTNIQLWRDRATFVFVSHRLAHVFAACDRIVAIKDGAVIAELAADSTDESALHELIVGRKRDSEYYKETRQRNPEPKAVLEARNLSRRGVFSDVSFSIRTGEIVGLAGIAGCGKSELARAVVGLERFERGELILSGTRLPPRALTEAIRRGVGYVPAERLREGIIAQDSILANLSLPLLDRLRVRHTPFVSRAASIRVVKEWMQRLSIKAAGPHALARSMSGGNQQKVVFAKVIARGVTVLVLDDPTRGLDVGAKEDVYSLLRDLADQGVAILLVSDNLPEVIGLSNRILTMRRGRLTGEIDAPEGSKPAEATVVRDMV
jgi:ribose transport system ATP-binding protein